MDPSIQCRFQPLSFSWVAVHPKPKGIIQFVGGAFFGTFPTIAYRYFLCQLFNQGYTIVALPFKFSLRHWPVSISLFKEQLRLRQKLSAVAQSLAYEHEIYCDSTQYFWLGHSLGCKYIALLELLSDDLWQSVIESCTGERELERIREAVAGLIDEKPSIKGQPSLLMAPDISDTESAIPIPFLARLFERFGFKVLPTRMQTRCFIERSNLFNLTALISFASDTIAGSKSGQGKNIKDVPWFSEQLQRRAFPLLHTELPGKHLEPLGVAVGRYIVDFNPFDKFFRLLPRDLEPVVFDYLEELARRATNPPPAGSVVRQQRPAQIFPPVHSSTFQHHQIGGLMATLSTFELLVKPLVPPMFDKLGAGRTIIQGYFLTIANTSAQPVSLRLKFTAKSPSFTAANVLAFFDILGSNDQQVIPAAPAATEILTFTLNIGPGDTGLFILQPNVTNPLLVTNPTTEIRGFVDISLTSIFGVNTFNLLVTPEHRGTFLPRGFAVPTPPLPSKETSDFDQLVYALPTAQGKALYTLKQVTLTGLPTEAPELQSIVELMGERLNEAVPVTSASNQAFIPGGGAIQPLPLPTPV